MLDILIQNAVVLDGTGAPGQRRDVGIQGGKLVMDPGNCQAAELVDASGLVLAPGFIDVHGHSDLFAFLDPLCEAKLCQGITTEIAGQCGISPAPVTARYLPVYQAYYGGMGAALCPHPERLTSVGALMDALEALHTGINLALFAAHGSLRMAAMGMDPGRPDQHQLDTMAALVREAMEDGAMGVSSGLMYAPGSFAEPDELEAVCRAAAPWNGIYTSHIRNQGNLLLDSVRETLQVARNAGLSANISHHKAVGRNNWGRTADSAALIRQEGNASHDVYPYTASSTVLSATLPPSWMRDGTDRLLQRLRDPAAQRELEQQIFHPTEEWDNDLLECGYDGILIVTAAETPEAVGKSILQCAELWGLSPFAAYCKLLADNHLSVNDICFSMSPDDVAQLIQDPLCMFGTDSTYAPQMGDMTHPRAIGTFPRILGRYVREQKLLPLEEAVRKMTGYPAQRYGLRGKGVIASGADADLVLFDPNTILDQADYPAPLQPNLGIARVYVNGQLAVLNGKPTGVRAGHVLRKR